MTSTGADTMMHIPIRADYHFDADGTMTRTHTEYADISADAFARFLLKGLGLSVEEVGQEETPDAPTL